METIKRKQEHHGFDRPFTLSRQTRYEKVKYAVAIFEAARKLSQKDVSLRIERPLDKDEDSDGPKKVTMVIRTLTDKEISTLLGVCVCQCEDWSTIFVMYCDTTAERANNCDDLSKELQLQVSRCTFKGNVVLGIVNGSSPRNCIPSNSQSGIMVHGIHSNALIINSIIEPYAAIYNNTLISNTFIGSSATVTNCGTICNSSKISFQDSMEIHLGPEAGGYRKVNVTPEITLVDICSSMLISNFGAPIRSSTTKAKRLPLNIILGKLHYNSTILNLYLSPGAIIESCSSISYSILLPYASIRNSTATASYLQWKCSISDNSTVSNVIMMECSAIGPNSVVASTVLGPDSHVSCGEVHCCLIGPNTNSHHQSLLISALWPLGRGNVGYGSNIGSNHTGRIPDQECTIGEGIFWGLGCVIKYPVDLSRAVYSVVAAGVHLPPQRVSMPFCLIMGSGSSSSHIDEVKGKNELVPGWVLKSSPYTIVRNEEKFKDRRKAKHHDFYCGWKIIRPETVDSCVVARDLLRRVGKKWNKSWENTDENRSYQVYTEALLPQLGCNYMTERGRRVGIDAYTSLIQRYALKGLLGQVMILKANAKLKSGYNLKNRLEALLQKPLQRESTSAATHDKVSWPRMPWDEKVDRKESLWEHQHSVLSLEIRSIVAKDESSIFEVLKLLLKKLKSLEQNYAAQVHKSKQRDDSRGLNIIPGYRVAHIMAEDDDIVKLTYARTEDIVEKITEISRLFDDLELDKSRSRL